MKSRSCAAVVREGVPPDPRATRVALVMLIGLPGLHAAAVRLRPQLRRQAHPAGRRGPGPARRRAASSSTQFRTTEYFDLEASCLDDRRPIDALMARRGRSGPPWSSRADFAEDLAAGRERRGPGPPRRRRTP
ncbi:MAG: hypothetical protein MZV63_72495 [Marinilabiliales bacterium]|nr:hypothetical protein [Marinilabiliales bacterium]